MLFSILCPRVSEVSGECMNPKCCADQSAVIKYGVRNNHRTKLLGEIVSRS